MDELHIKHAFDQIEMHQEQLKNYLLNGPLSNEKIDDLEAHVSDLEDDISKLEDEKRDLEIECDDLKKDIENVRAILEDLSSQDAGFDYVKERATEALELL